MTPEDKTRAKLLNDFRQSTIERVEKIALAWLSLERNPGDVREAEELLRQIHSLKGEATMMGLPDVSVLAHRAEEIVIAARECGFDVPNGVGDAILACTDAVAGLVQSSPYPRKGRVDLTLLVERCDEILALLAQESASSAGEDPPDPSDRTTPGSNAATVPDTTTAQTVDGPPAPLAVRVNAVELERFADAAADNVIGHGRYAHATTVMRTVIHDAIEALVALQRSESSCSNDETAGLASPSHAVTGMDDLISTAQRELRKAERTAEMLKDQIAIGASVARALDADSRQLLLVPVRDLFNKATRIARDLSQSQGKQLVLHALDNDIRIDRAIVNALSEPMLHLVRNSVDHGLEPPDERTAAGKQVEGAITLSAEQRGAFVTVTVADDGRGIDYRDVREKALNAGLIGEEELRNQGDDDVHNLLFLPGFSTRSQADAVSGRGLGLDVVKTTMESLGGKVEVRSQAGQGTRFALTLLNTLSLTRGLVVVCNSRRYAIPSRYIERAVCIDTGMAEYVHGYKAIRLESDVIPLVHLGRLLGSDDRDEVGHAVVLRHGLRLKAIVVDRLHGEIDIVVKPHDAITATRIFSGTCLMPDGGLALVLDPPELVLAVARETFEREASPDAEDEVVLERKKVLVVEDQAITRTIVARSLRALGYDVVEASNGRMALTQLAREAVDLVITDLEMPVMGGIELIESLRASSLWQSLPVVVLSTRGSDEDKRTALKAGANEYLVKSALCDRALRETLTRRLGKP